MDAPHDALFRFAFTQAAVVADHWRASFPPDVAARIRWDTLELLPGSFVDEDLKQVHSDVLHRVVVEDGSELWLYVLFEHQSTVDSLILRRCRAGWPRRSLEPAVVTTVTLEASVRPPAVRPPDRPGSAIAWRLLRYMVRI